MFEICLIRVIKAVGQVLIVTCSMRSIAKAWVSEERRNSHSFFFFLSISNCVNLSWDYIQLQTGPRVVFISYLQALSIRFGWLAFVICLSWGLLVWICYYFSEDVTFFSFNCDHTFTTYHLHPVIGHRDFCVYAFILLLGHKGVWVISRFSLCLVTYVHCRFHYSPLKLFVILGALWAGFFFLFTYSVGWWSVYVELC